MQINLEKFERILLLNILYGYNYFMMMRDYDDIYEFNRQGI